MEPCIKENELGKMAAILERVSKEIYGNGELGLAKTVPRLETKIDDLVSSVNSHTRIISNLIEFQAKYDGEEKGKKDLEAKLLVVKELEATKQRDKLQRRFWYVMAIIGVVGIVLTILLNFKTNKEVNNIEPTIKNEIRMQEGISKVTRGGYVKYNDKGLSDSVKVK